MRWAPLGLVGCVWLSEADLSDRLDHDLDGYPVTLDCDDEDVAVALLSDVAVQTIACGDTLTVSTVSTSGLEISACPDPGSSTARLPFEQNVVLALEIDPSRPEVLAKVEVPSGSTFPSDEIEGLRASLFALRGPTCAAEDCSYGLPLRDPATFAQTDTWMSELAFTVVDGESWFLVVAGSIGEGELSVVCTR